MSDLTATTLIIIALLVFGGFVVYVDARYGE